MDGWTIAGAVAGVVGALAAIAALIVAVVAARYAKQSVIQGLRSQEAAQHALEQGQRSQEVADDRYRRGIQPRPRITGTRTGTSTSERIVHLTNPGGRATACLVVVRYADAMSEFHENVYAGEGSLPADDSADVLVRRRYTLSGGASPNARAVILAARDVHDTWWDCIAGHPVDNLQSWWRQQFQTLELPPMDIEESDDGLTIRIVGW